MSVEPTFKLFVGGLPENITEQELRTVFGTYGEVKQVIILQPKSTHYENPTRCCMLIYTTQDAAETAIQVLNEQYRIRDDALSPIKVSWARTKEADDAAPVEADIDGWKLFVGGLPHDVREPEIHVVFSTYGDVRKVYIMPLKEGMTRAAAFVFFTTKESADSAIKALDNVYKIRDAQTPISVKWGLKKKKEWSGDGNVDDGRRWAPNWSGASAISPVNWPGITRNPGEEKGGGGRLASWGAGGGAMDMWMPGAAGYAMGGQTEEGPLQDADGFKLFVGGLPTDIFEEALRLVFSTYGTVTKIHIMKPHESTGMVAAFVWYEQQQSGENAIKLLNDAYKIKEDSPRPIKVSWGKAGKKRDDWAAMQAWGGKFGGPDWKDGCSAGFGDLSGAAAAWAGCAACGGCGGCGGCCAQAMAPALTPALTMAPAQLGEAAVEVGNLPEDIVEESVRYVFQTYGTVEKVEFAPGTGNGKAAVVTYARAEEASVAVQVLDSKYEIKPGFGPLTVRPVADRARPY